MSPAEFEVWREEYCRNPWGEVRADNHAALIAERITNMAGKMLQDGHVAKHSDYLLTFNREAIPEQEPDPAAFFGPFIK